MGINENFRDLSIGLPGDVERRKQHGDLKGAIRLIDRRLQEDVPEPLKRCMIAQREMMLRLPMDYPFDRAAALAVVRRELPGFTEQEFDEFVDANKIDWIYIDGQERFFKRFFPTLMKVYPDFAARVSKARGEEEQKPSSAGLLTDTIREIKEKGGVGYRFRMRASVQIDEKAFEKGGTALVHLPIPADARQISDIVLHEMSDEPLLIAPADAKQRTVAFSRRLDGNEPFFVEYSFTNTVHYIDAYHSEGVAGAYDFDVDEEPPHIIFTPYIRQLVHDLAGHTDDPMAKARCFYDFITKKVKYSFMRAYFGLENIAENCARNLRGDCGVQALLFITLCRCAGIPARWQSCLCAQPPEPGAHDWAEFYVEPYGWLFCDPSFGGSAFRAGNEERREFYFGNLDPFRMIANSGFQSDLVPEKKHWRADPYDNQTGEIEYADRGLRYDEYHRDQVILSCEKI